MRDLKQSTTANVMVLMVDNTSHVTGATGLTLTVTLSKDGGAFAGISPTVIERGNGWYKIELTSSHTDTPGDLVLHVSASNADPADIACRVHTQVVEDVLATAGYTAPDSASTIATAVANFDLATLEATAHDGTKLGEMVALIRSTTGGKASISAGTYTYYEADGTTVLATLTINDTTKSAPAGP